VLFFLANFNLVIAAENEKTTGNKSEASSLTDDGRDIKKEFKKTKDTTKDAMVRNIQEMKEQTPKDLKETKEELIKKKDEVKEMTKQELKEIREGLQKPLKPAKSE
jgi:hypothetical protein